MGSAGKTAPSFIITILLLVVAVVGYLAWGILSPSPVARSEMVVRDFSAAAASELSALRRALREDLEQYESAPDKADEVRAAIDEDAEAAAESIADMADEARDEIGLIDGIGLRTQDNRLNRIKKREADALSRAEILAAEARAKLAPE